MLFSEDFIAARPSGDKVLARAASGCVGQSATQLVGHLCVKLIELPQSLKHKVDLVLSAAGLP
jgi:NADPH:quinone reductase-like Zn-dependent oxidoreductase